jgi:hypothetical protein
MPYAVVGVLAQERSIGPPQCAKLTAMTTPVVVLQWLIGSGAAQARGAAAAPPTAASTVMASTVMASKVMVSTVMVGTGAASAAAARGRLRAVD